jgi:hypothetical protein
MRLRLTAPGHDRVLGSATVRLPRAGTARRRVRLRRAAGLDRVVLRATVTDERGRRVLRRRAVRLRAG